MQSSLESTLSKLVSIPSVSSDTAACLEVLEYVRGEIEPLGLFITADITSPSPWLMATTRDTKNPDILLVSHLDVVPGPSELFTLRNEDGKFYGRGVYDMKLAAACYLEFVKNHASSLHTMNIGLLFTTDEETGSASMPAVMEHAWRPKLAFIPDGGDNWCVEERAKGLYGVEVIAHGKTAHGSRPWEGDNALHRLMEALAVLRRSFPSVAMGDSTLSVNTIHGGEAANQIADHAMAAIDFRSFSNEELAVYRAQLHQVAHKYRLDVKVLQDGPPLHLNKSAPAIQNFFKVVQEYTGKDIAYCSSYGASDARFFAKYDIPCIVIEPRGGGRHSPDEWLLAADLERYYQLIERWLLSEHAIASERGVGI